MLVEWPVERQKEGEDLSAASRHWRRNSMKWAIELSSKRGLEVG
jgi:hypothetical protein